MNNIIANYHQINTHDTLGHGTTLKKHLTKARQMFNNVALTKKHNRQCKVLNSAFFVPKNHQGGVLTLPFGNDLSMKNQVHILKYGRVKAWNIRPNLLGNICSRVIAISDTRPPGSKLGGLTKNNNGGQTMPLNTSNGGYIRQIQAVATLNGIQASIYTKHRQTQAITCLFLSMASLRQFIVKQGLNPSLVNWRVA